MSCIVVPATDRHVKYLLAGASRVQPNEKRFIKRSGTPEANVSRVFSRVKPVKRRWR